MKKQTIWNKNSSNPLGIYTKIATHNLWVFVTHGKGFIANAESLAVLNFIANHKLSKI